jgi:hypothetical protein
VNLKDDTHSADLAVFRDKSWNAILFFTGIAFLTMGIALFRIRPPDLAGHVIIPLVAWALAVLNWLLLVVAAVRVRADGVVIDNLVVRHVIPWERFAGVFVESGMGIFARLDDGRVVSSRAFGRSLGDALQGYSRMRRTLEQIRPCANWPGLSILR